MSAVRSPEIVGVQSFPVYGGPGVILPNANREMVAGSSDDQVYFLNVRYSRQPLPVDADHWTSLQELSSEDITLHPSIGRVGVTLRGGGYTTQLAIGANDETSSPFSIRVPGSEAPLAVRYLSSANDQLRDLVDTDRQNNVDPNIDLAKAARVLSSMLAPSRIGKLEPIPWKPRIIPPGPIKVARPTELPSFDRVLRIVFADTVDTTQRPGNGRVIVAGKDPFEGKYGPAKVPEHGHAVGQLALGAVLVRDVRWLAPGVLEGQMPDGNFVIRAGEPVTSVD